jgi:tRNA pseudouridine38-40 synthase
VHASQFFFHLNAEEELDARLVFNLNNTLPNDIAVFDMMAMDGQPHARFDAIERSYDYFIHTYKDPFLGNFSSMYPVKDWDIGNMQRAANLLLNYTDYRAFCKMPDRNDNTICHISQARIYTDSTGDKLRFHISANRFLGRMVRIITNELIEIGTGKLSVDAFEAHLINPQLLQPIKAAYPQGLYLSKIKYPYLDIPPRSDFAQMLTAVINTPGGH